MAVPYDLYQFFQVQELTPLLLECLKRQYRQICLPTEVVITEAGFFTPQMARVYTTNLWLYENELLTYKELMHAAGDCFRGTLHYVGVVLTEIWVNCGEDGHVRYQLQGFQLQPEGKIDFLRQGEKEYEDG